MAQLERCNCGSEVLVVLGLGESYVLEPLEVLPEGPCGFCKGKGTVHGADQRHLSTHFHDARVLYPTGRATCGRCNGTGRRGEPIKRGLVLVDEWLHARRCYGERRKGEAAHRPHECAEASLAA